MTKIEKLLFQYNRSHILAIVATVFALIYHVSFLIVFACLKVTPMFYFNFLSVSIFTTVTILLVKKYFKVKYFIISYLEVLIHQILGCYFLGGITGFHFFILLMGCFSFLLFESHYGYALFFGIFSGLVFIALDLISPLLHGIYPVDIHIQSAIRGVNLFVSVGIIIISLWTFMFIVVNMEKHLEDQVNTKSNKVREQNEELEETKKELSETQERQQRELLKTRDRIILSLAGLVENRDADTGDHLQRTGAYVRMLAVEAKRQGYMPEIITDEFITLLEKAAPMHDIGKIVVSDSILKKPGKLTPDEFELMKLHTTEGGRIVNNVISISDNEKYLKMAREVATCHHERWDGTGYPNRYAQTDIPLSARIMAIADVFDALVSPRCYKKPIPQEEAFKIIEEEAGTHFDPELVKIFLSIKEDVIKVLEKYSN